MSFLSKEVAQKSIHIVLGSFFDKNYVMMVVESLKNHGYLNPAIHVFSSHRNPRHVVQFTEEFEGAIIIAIGGLSFQLPAVLDSLFRDLGKHVVIFGLPVGSTPEKREIAISAMRDLPAPCLVHWEPEINQETVDKIAFQAVGFLRGSVRIDGESQADWDRRLAIHKQQTSRINVRLEELR